MGWVIWQAHTDSAAAHAWSEYLADSAGRSIEPMSPLIHLTDQPPNAETPIPALGAGTLPNDEFYVRCNFPVPHLDAATWRLEVSGAFARPRGWTLDELRALPPVERTVTLECAGNGRTLMSPVPSGTPWGLGAVGTTRFGGARLSDVLAASEPNASALEMVFTGADRGHVQLDGAIAYQFNLDAATALGDGPMLAWEMNGRPLPAEHGFPVRLVVPGQYGMRSVKWLMRITAVARLFAGHFPRKYRYRGDAGVADETPVGPIRVRSLITSPSDGERLPVGPTTVRGIAWSGNGPITDVEVDAGEGWLPARLAGTLDDAGGASFTFDWTPRAAGPHLLAVRATDQAGNCQPQASVWNEDGYGNNVVQRISVEAE